MLGKEKKTVKVSLVCVLTLPRAMVKCLIRIKTKVNVHLRMINHCYRDVKVRVLSLGPRLLGKALGVLPLFPALPEGSSTPGSGPGSGQSSRTASRLAVPPQQYGSSAAANRAGKKKKMQQQGSTVGPAENSCWSILKVQRVAFSSV